MKNRKQTLFTIYKNGNHLGNEKGDNINTAIKKYLIAAWFEEFVNNEDYVSIYSGEKAMIGIHFL